MYPNNPMLNQQMAQLEQEFAQRKSNLIQSFYQSQQSNNWNNNQNMSMQNQTQTQSAPAPAQNVTWITVNGLSGAKEHYVPKNETHWLMDSGDSVFYVKESDEFGTMKMFKGYRFAEIPENELSGITEQVDMSQYVSKAEFDELKAKLEQLTDKKTKPSAKANKGVDDNG